MASFSLFGETSSSASPPAPLQCRFVRVCGAESAEWVLCLWRTADGDDGIATDGGDAVYVFDRAPQPPRPSEWPFAVSAVRSADGRFLTLHFGGDSAAVVFRRSEAVAADRQRLIMLLAQSVASPFRPSAPTPTERPAGPSSAEDRKRPRTTAQPLPPLHKSCAEVVSSRPLWCVLCR